MSLTFEDIAFELAEQPMPLELSDLFEEDRPLHVEIGSGKGTFLVAFGKDHPEVNLIGVEWANKYYRYTVDRLRRWGLKQVRVVRTDARDFVSRYLPGGSVAVFHIYFPDPWPKKRHHKRRFFQEATVRELLRCLVKGGQLRIATDHAGYFAAMEELFEKEVFRACLGRIDFASWSGQGEGEVVGTNFERKYLREGRSIYTLALEKTGEVGQEQG